MIVCELMQNNQSPVIHSESRYEHCQEKPINGRMYARICRIEILMKNNNPNNFSTPSERNLKFLHFHQFSKTKVRLVHVVFARHRVANEWVISILNKSSAKFQVILAKTKSPTMSSCFNLRFSLVNARIKWNTSDCGFTSPFFLFSCNDICKHIHVVFVTICEWKRRMKIKYEWLGHHPSCVNSSGICAIWPNSTDLSCNAQV